MGRIFLITSFVLFTVIGIAALMKGKSSKTDAPIAVQQEPEEFVPVQIDLFETAEEKVIEIVEIEDSHVSKTELITSSYPLPLDGLPTSDQIELLFTTGDHKLPFVKTVRYKSHVPWLKGRPAWISDYATHFDTSTHFIARSLHGKGKYYKQDVANGDHFNVFDPEKDIEFNLVVDLSRCHLWLYAYEKNSHRRFLIKDYPVGLGRPDPLKSSGLLTPRGKYSLGNRIAAFKPKTTGFHNGEKIEMIRVFGSRWIPFDKEISGTSLPAKGFGLHGVPWKEDIVTGVMQEDLESLGTYTSDGCIRLSSNDIEEIYAIIASKPSFIELVNDFNEAKLPGEEF